jgi:Type II secretion system (T2SS), protein M
MFDALRKRLGAAASDARERFAPAWKTLNARLSEALAPLRIRYQKLEPRERLLVRILGVVLAIVVAYTLVYTPISAAVGGLGGRIQQRQHDAVEVANMMRTYRQLQGDLATMRKRTVPAKGDFSLFSVVEQALSQSPGKDKIGSLTPADKPIPGGLTQYTVQANLTALSLSQIVDMLYGLRKLSVPVTISSLRITRRTGNSHAFDVEMTCVALGRNA